MFLIRVIFILLGFCGTLYAENIPAGRYDRSKEVNKSLHLVNASFGPANFFREQGDIAYFLKLSDEFDIADKASALIAWNIVFDESSKESSATIVAEQKTKIVDDGKQSIEEADDDKLDFFNDPE